MSALPAARLLDGLVDRVLAVAGAVLFAQAPEFFQQYLQRLGGHLDEARLQLAAFERTAAQAGLPLEQFIRKTAANTDTTVARLAEVMQGAAARVTELDHAYVALRDAFAWSRPFIFLRDLDLGIARATAHAFRPAVPTTIEGACYALTGMAIFLGVYHFGLRPLGAKVFRVRTRTTPGASTA